MPIIRIVQAAISPNVYLAVLTLSFIVLSVERLRTRRLIWGVFALLPLVQLGLIAWLYLGPNPEDPKNVAKYGMIHKPKGGCPAGFTEVADIFTEADGRKLPACAKGIPPEEPLAIIDNHFSLSPDLQKAKEAPGPPGAKPSR